MIPADAHVAAAVLAVADLVTRALRVRLLVRASGAPLRWRDAMALTAFGDAAAAVTPWRAGGEVARVLGAKWSGVPIPMALMVMAVESAVGYALAALTGAWLAAEYGGDWMREIPRGGLPLAPDLVYAVAVLACLVATVVFSVPAARAWLSTGVAALASAGRAVRALAPRVIVLCAILSAASLASRVLILPSLATGSGSAPLGVLALVSFTMLHVQVALPTPGGAGPIEIAFLAGAAVAPAGGEMLGWWRVYVTLFPVVAGVGVGAPVYGRKMLTVLPGRSRIREE